MGLIFLSLDLGGARWSQQKDEAFFIAIGYSPPGRKKNRPTWAAHHRTRPRTDAVIFICILFSSICGRSDDAPGACAIPNRAGSFRCLGLVCRRGTRDKRDMFAACCCCALGKQSMNCSIKSKRKKTAETRGGGGCAEWMCVALLCVRARGQRAIRQKYARPRQRA